MPEGFLNDRVITVCRAPVIGWIDQLKFLPKNILQSAPVTQARLFTRNKVGGGPSRFCHQSTSSRPEVGFKPLLLRKPDGSTRYQILYHALGVRDHHRQATRAGMWRTGGKEQKKAPHPEGQGWGWCSFPAITYFRACGHYHELSELNCRVRNGNECFLTDIVTGKGRVR